LCAELCADPARETEVPGVAHHLTADSHNTEHGHPDAKSLVDELGEVLDRLGLTFAAE
jgi:hypothetical protein